MKLTVLAIFTGDNRPRLGDVMLSFLPLAHMLERCFENGVYYSGGAVGFYSGNIRDLTSDLRALRPTIMPAVPRLLNRVHDKTQAEISQSSFKRMIYHMALKSKEAELKRQIIRRNSMWDKLVFKQIQECKLTKCFDLCKRNWKQALFLFFRCYSIRRKPKAHVIGLSTIVRNRIDFHALRSWLCYCGRLWTNRMHSAHFTHYSW